MLDEDLPGATHDGPTRERLGAEKRAKPPIDPARVHHKNGDGSPRYTNRLILESSPYLLQHAHNPVDWYAWGEEALAAARRLDRPILLSIGYSTCHWCHVMEGESFEDVEIARYLNENYVAIKLDREERPDLDALYMATVQLLTGRGGWPLNAWLSPDGRPFYAGTYFPARDGDRGAGMGFLTLLARLRDIYRNEPEKIRLQGEQLVADLSASARPPAGDGGRGARELGAESYRVFKDQFDPYDGGFGHAPKFPRPAVLDFLMGYAQAAGESHAFTMAAETLKKMARGGIMDQVGGGFHRYSVDGTWTVPHFEKMLYDNAQLLHSFATAYQHARDPEFAYAARMTAEYLIREMRDPRGGFYSATDADSEGEEGKFFVWQSGEIAEILGADSARYARFFPGIDTANFEGHVIPTRAAPPESADDGAFLDRCHEKLRRERARRIPPLLDDKILASWNGLVIAGLARAGFVFDESSWIDAARGAAAFVTENLFVEGRLLRSERRGQRGRTPGFLDDYVFMIFGLLELFEATGDPRWFNWAQKLEKIQADLFVDPAQGGFLLSSREHERLVTQERPFYDGAEPAGNSVALLNSAKLYALTWDEDYRRRAAELEKSLAPLVGRAPYAAPLQILARLQWAAGPIQVVVTGADPGVWNGLRAVPAFNAARVRLAPGGEDLVAALPNLTGKPPAEARTYVCRAGTCESPARTVEEAARQISKNTRLAP